MPDERRATEGLKEMTAIAEKDPRWRSWFLPPTPITVRTGLTIVQRKQLKRLEWTGPVPFSEVPFPTRTRRLIERGLIARDRHGVVSLTDDGRRALAEVRRLEETPA